MKAVLEIIPGKIDAANCVLICEAGSDGFSYVVKNEESNEFTALGVYHFSSHYTSESSSPVLKEIFKNESLLSEPFKKVFIVYSYPESVLVPFEMYNSQKNSSVLNMIHGDLTENDAVLSDVIVEVKAYNIYRIPSKLKDEIQSQFPSAECLHQYSALAKNISTGENKLNVIFYPNKIVLTLIKEGKLQLVNSFPYKNAEDVSYILLNVCHQFEMDNVIVEASGLVEENSGLYKEIYKYFEQVRFATMPEGISIHNDVAAYPSHFFSHFFTLA
ncbi:MAG: DUF3822 family protein [Ginsengibacter sp.]